MSVKVKPREATAIINSLISGVVPKIGVQHITVGRADEVNMVLAALEDVKNGHSIMKFWIGDFGSGKSFMLHLLNTVALKQKFVVTQADLTPHVRLYSNDGKGLALYTALMDNISIQTKPEGGALHILLEKWIEQTIMQAALSNNIPVTEIRNDEHISLIQNEIIKTINIITEIGSLDFGIAIIRYYEGFVSGNDILLKNALRWMKGEYTTRIDARKDLGVSDIVSDRNYYDMLKNFCRLFVSIGFSGLVVNFDEAVNLYKIANPGMRQRNYEKLLSMYNDCFQGKVGNIFFNIAGTTETLEDPKKGFYSYGAMKTRLQVNKFETASLRDYAQPVIRLMPLDHNEIFVLLHNLKEIFDFNYQVNINFPDEDIKTYMEELHNKPGADEFLTPRAVIRDFLNILNILRQNPKADKAALFEKISITDEQLSQQQEPDIVLKDKLVRKIEKQCHNLMLPPEIIEKLAEVLMDDENILKSVTCSIKNEAGTLLATERRLVFISKKLKTTSFPYSQINEMTYTAGYQYSVLQMLFNNEQTAIDFIPNSRMKQLLNLLQAQIEILERKTLSAELKYWEKEISGSEVKSLLNKMSKIAFMIQEKNLDAGQLFTMRHIDTISKILRQYYELEASGIETQEFTVSKQRITESLTITKKAFEQELINILKTDMLDVDAEAEAYIQSLKNKGLVEN